MNMTDYTSVSDALDLAGLRVVFSPGFPGPWSVAARIILDVKSIRYTPVAQSIGANDKALRDWTGQESAPVAVLDKERARARWDEILLLAERLNPEPRLVPADEVLRTDMFGLANAICGEDGFGWNFRLYQMASWENALAGKSSDPVFLDRNQVDVMQFRYGDPSRDAPSALARMASICGMLADRLCQNRQSGSAFLVGNQLTAVDIYWAIFSNLVAPIRSNYCPGPEVYRDMATRMGDQLGQALDPILIEHREHVLEKHCPLPLKF